MTSKRKKQSKKRERRGEERKPKVQVKTDVSLFNTKTVSRFCFLCMLKL